MSSYTSTLTASPAPRSGHAKLHKRHSSGSSLPSSPPMGAHGIFNTPFATQEEPFASVGSSSGPTSSTPKIKPYLRKMSGAKEMDQGKLDLSKPVSENERLAGLGIQDFGTRSVSDVTFAHAGKRGTHARTISVGSQASAGSNSFRPTQPFVHPMRQTPRPYETLAGSSNASIVDDEEARESLDVVRDDFRSQPFRNNRSMSISSNLPGMPTPLSQSHTVDDLGYVPKLTNSESLTNLSIISGQSSKSRKGRSRRNTDQTMDVPTPSSRTSFDKALSFVSRPSDPEPQTRDERIREQRRKFQQKEASKDMKQEREAAKRREAEYAKKMKRQERQRRKSEAEERAKLTRSLPSTDSASKILPKRSKTVDEEKQGGMLHSRSYQESQPSLVPPRQGLEAVFGDNFPGTQVFGGA
ncbi:hypothetical protein EJ03DRAFT_335632 [Teratosphaeria nubilosa]|uniref:Uncharacterized protein n=1 Tax=Teratosphaeria nubilosa TaxID=161662 RepID=A0A6G1LBG0_9PEZI|nr:hypothetical protein EJ03DRAFT_335632 [Teratosphaeria nubilosa]